MNLSFDHICKEYILFIHDFASYPVVIVLHNLPHLLSAPGSEDASSECLYRASTSIESCIPSTELVYLALKLIKVRVRDDVGCACPALAPMGELACCQY
jgi:hypothetical protein